MKTCKLIIFVLVSVLEVHVQAKDFLSLPLSKDIMLEPVNCILRSSVCTVSTGIREKFVLTFGTNEVTLGPKTVVIREGADSVHLIEGVILVKGDKKTIVKSEFGQVASLGGEYVVSREAGRIMVHALTSAVTLLPRGSNEELTVEPGFQNWLYKVSKSGAAQSGIPLVWNFDGMVRTWARLYSGSKIEFRKKIRGLNQVWSDAVITASQRHKLYAERSLASAQEEREQRRRQQSTEAEERRQIRQMMIQRNHLDLF